MTNRAMCAALALLSALAAGCTESAPATAEVADAAPAVAAPEAGEPDAPVATAEEPAAAVAPASRAIDDGSFRALAEEVAKLRAQLASMQKAAAAPKPQLIEPVPPEGVAPEAEDAVFEDEGPEPQIVEVRSETY